LLMKRWNRKETISQVFRIEMWLSSTHSTQVNLVLQNGYAQKPISDVFWDRPNDVNYHVISSNRPLVFGRYNGRIAGIGSASHNKDFVTPKKRIAIWRDRCRIDVDHPFGHNSTVINIGGSQQGQAAIHLSGWLPKPISNTREELQFDPSPSRRKVVIDHAITPFSIC